MKVVLCRAPDEQKQFGDAIQRDISAVIDALRADGVQVSATWFAMDAVDAGGGTTGALSLLGPLGIAAIGAFAGWLKGRSGRTVKLKVGDVEGEAHSVEELKDVFALAPNVRQANETKRIHE